MTLFDWLNQIRIYKKPWESFTEEDQKVFQPYMINRFLSMDESLIHFVNYFQKYSIGLLESKEIYKWYCQVVPKGKKWNKYIKSKKLEKYKPLVVDVVKKHYEIGTEECCGCLELLYKTKEGKQNLKEILKLYGNG